MTPEWRELYRFVETLPAANKDHAEIREIVKMRMAEIERRTLPERVAEILRNASTRVMIEHNDIRLGASIGRYIRLEVARALESGDTRRIETWVKPLRDPVSLKVAEILRGWEFGGFMGPTQTLFDAFAKALESGNTEKIEKWGKGQNP